MNYIAILRRNSDRYRRYAEDTGLSISPNACKMVSNEYDGAADQLEATVKALITILSAHKFNYATLAPHEVHALCHDALAAIYGTDEDGAILFR